MVQTDNGIEPNTQTPHMWMSNNIWVRHNNDNGLTHQNPEYSSNGNLNYIKVRVINKSSITSSGNEQLKLHWAKASTALTWPVSWDGSSTIFNPAYNQSFSLGDELGTLNIPALQPGQETIITFPWAVPDPDHYSNINPDPWHFCLLSRIVSNDDPMTVAEIWDVNANT